MGFARETKSKKVVFQRYIPLIFPFSHALTVAVAIKKKQSL